MPAKSKAQRTAFAMALAARRGDVPAESLTGAARLLYKDKTLTREQLKDYASTKERGLPTKKSGIRVRRTFKRT